MNWCNWEIESGCLLATNLPARTIADAAIQNPPETKKDGLVPPRHSPFSQQDVLLALNHLICVKIGF